MLIALNSVLVCLKSQEEVVNDSALSMHTVLKVWGPGYPFLPAIGGPYLSIVWTIGEPEAPMLVNHVLAVQHSEHLCHAWFQVCKMLCVGMHGRPQTLCNDAMIAAILMVYNITRTF